MAANVQAPPAPSAFFKAAWRIAKRVPGVFFVRLAYDFFATFFRIATLFVVGLAFVVHFGDHLSAGHSLLSWPNEMLQVVTRPGTIVGLAGTIFMGWMLLFAAEAMAAAGIWGAVTDVLAGRQVSRFGTAIRAGVIRFPEAVLQRIFATFVEATLFAVTIGTCIAAYAAAGKLQLWFGESIVLSAATWASLLTLLACSAVLVRLTAEFVAASLFIDGIGLGEAISRAAEAVVAHPIHLYRLFVLAAGILIAPLFGYWLAILLQNFAVNVPALSTAAMLVRMGAEMLLLAGFAAFIVMLQASFFTYYAWWNGTLDPALLAENPVARGEVPDLEALLPKKYDVIVDVDDLLGPWDSDDVLPPSDPAEQQQVAQVVEGPFDLGAILTGDEADEEE